MATMNTAPAMATTTPYELEASAYAKVTRRLIPFLFVCYIVSWLDRVNIGFAKLQMQSDLKFSDTVYGLGAGIFFIGYFLFEVPSNVILHRAGARVWIARIMISWGVLSSLMMYASSPLWFYVLRFLIGVAEAGFFPGIILYLTYWYPARRRGRIVALFLTAIATTSVIGAPLSGWILKSMNGWHGLAGWQWLFLLEGIPSLVMGLWTLAFLDDGIRASRWLSEEEKQLLERNISSENAQKTSHSFRHAFGDAKVWLLAFVYLCFVSGLYGISFWLPQIIKNTGVKDPLDVGLLTAVPWGIGAVGMLWWGRNSDRTGERRWHAALAGFIGGVGMLISTAYGSQTLASMVALTVATLGIQATLPVFWSLPTAFLTGGAAAAGIAWINSVGNLGGFIAPFLVGWLKDLTHSTATGLYVLSGGLVLGGILVLTFIPARLFKHQ
jgi:D-galactonate transporter